jgi:uncharacterized membrane protein YdjX (TVP38/TMEM64 family)
VRRRPALRFAALVALVAGAALVGAVSGLPRPGTLTDAAARAGGVHPVLAVLAAAVLLAALVPRTVLAAVAGLLFGALPGALYVLCGALLGAAVAFALGRWLGRDFVGGRRRVVVLDAWLSRRGVLGVLLLRLLPIAPFGLVSYAFGTSGVRWGAYLAGTGLGALPSTVVYATLGATALSPGTPAFAVSVAAAVTMGVASSSAAAVLTRRAARREAAGDRGRDEPGAAGPR